MMDRLVEGLKRMGLLAFLGLFACENTQTVFVGTFKGETYRLLSVETKGFSTNSIDYALKLGRLKPVKIDALTTDWGPPYADDVYGNAPRVYLNVAQPPYSNERDDPQQHPGTMVYLSPNRFTIQAYTQYANLLKSEWPRIDRQFSRHDDDRFPQIMGLVYGEPQTFTRTFRGKQTDKDYLIQIRPDGRIQYTPEKEWANEEYSGLSEKVQMPGKLIYVATGKEARLSLAMIQTYRDTAGKTLGDYFLLREKPTTTAEPAQ